MVFGVVSLGARDAIHGTRVEFLKPGGIGGFGGESGGVQYRSGLTEQGIRLDRD
jgi:3,4-dihydroxy-2-butanone 4-phosphate synthase